MKTYRDHYGLNIAFSTGDTKLKNLAARLYGTLQTDFAFWESRRTEYNDDLDGNSAITGVVDAIARPISRAEFGIYAGGSEQKS